MPYVGEYGGIVGLVPSVGTICGLEDSVTYVGEYGGTAEDPFEFGHGVLGEGFSEEGVDGGVTGGVELDTEYVGE